MNTSASVVKLTYLIFAALICAWTLAWWAKVAVLDLEFIWLATSWGGFTFWTIAKGLIWILPAVVLIRISGRTFREVFNFSNWKSWLAWGGGAGLLIALTGWVPNYLGGNPVFPTEWSLALLNVLLIAPVFEEFIMRGAILGNLLTKYSIIKANLVSSAMFVLLHMPGWFFMGSLAENLTKPIGGAASIFLLSLVFGYVVYRSRSVLSGMLAHFLNNLSSAA